MIAALKLLKDAAAMGWTFVVPNPDYAGGEPDYKGASAAACWAAVKATDEANVVFYDAAGKKVGVAYLMAPGPITCDPEETLVDWGPADGGEFDKLCDGVIEAAL